MLTEHGNVPLTRERLRGKIVLENRPAYPSPGLVIDDLRDQLVQANKRAKKAEAQRAEIVEMIRKMNTKEYWRLRNGANVVLDILWLKIIEQNEGANL